MKKEMLTFGLAAVSFAGIMAFTEDQTSITGRVSPADGAAAIWAVSGTDSTKGAISAGTFAIALKAGTYKIIVDGKDPYKDVVLENLEVKQDQPIDVGEIILQK